MKIQSDTGFGEQWRFMDISKVQEQIESNKCFVYLHKDKFEHIDDFLDMKNVIGLVSDIKEKEDCFSIEWGLLKTQAASEVKLIMIADKGKISTNIIYDEENNSSEFHSFTWLCEMGGTIRMVPGTDC